MRVRSYRLLALGGLGASARGVGAGTAVGLNVRAGGLVLRHSLVGVSGSTVTANTHRHVDGLLWRAVER